MKTIGIIGRGFVGQILKKYYPQAKVYDIVGECDKLEDVLRQDIIFIAFLTKDNSGDGIADYAKQAPAGRLFIIKSTFVPGTCDKLQNEFPQHNFVYNPELLTEATAWLDFTNPEFQVLGCPHQTLPLVHEIFSILPHAPIKRVISPIDAEMWKHVKNSYYGMKVVFFNTLFDDCKKVGSDYETIRELLTKDAWIGDSHSIIFHKGYRSYGTPRISKCIPKDLQSYIKLTHNPLLKKVDEINDKYVKDQNL